MVATVSVIIPCYNAQRFVGGMLESVFRQTWHKLEIIVVDDGSSDDSVNVVRSFADPRLTVICQSNSGAAAARNRGLSASQGDFIQFLDADDLLSADKIELQLARIERRRDVVASAEWGRFYNDANETRFDREDVWQDLDPIDWLALSRADGLGMMFPALWLIPMEVVRKAGPWDESLSLADDAEYFTRILLASDRVLFCDGARCHYRSGIVGSLSGHKSPAAWRSQFRVTSLCEQYMRAREDSDRVRRDFSLSWQHLAHSCYPYDRAMAEMAMERARALHPVSIRPGGGVAFKVVSRLFGWRLARRLQVASGRL
jgi:glycosyltransferase involved in cell wall biosynthesis